MTVPAWSSRVYEGSVESTSTEARSSAAAQMLQDEEVRDKFNNMKDARPARGKRRQEFHETGARKRSKADDE